MNIKWLLFVLFIGQLILAQDAVQGGRAIEWAHYYFINEDYDKALREYLKLGDDIPLASRRNLSKIYGQDGELKKAAEILRPLVDSDSAKVKDYYYFASYLTENEKLRDEYRQKAIRLPIAPPPFKVEPQASPYELIPLELNTEMPEFGAHLMNYKSNNLLIYTQKQSKKYSKALSKKIRSDHPIFNLYQAQWDADNFKTSFENPFPLGLNSVFQDGPSSWDPEDQLLYLSRSAPLNKKQKTLQLDIYAWPAHKDPKATVRELPFNSEGHATLHPSVSMEDRKLYFASDRPGGYGGMDLYYVLILGDGRYGTPVNLGPDINTDADEIFPFAYRGEYLFFSTKNKQGKLSPRLAVHSVDVRWQVHDLPSPFESTGDDFSIFLDPNLDYGLLSSNREAGKGDDDLYAFKFTPEMVGEEDLYTYNPIDTLIVSEDGVLKNDAALMLSQDPITVLFPKEAVLVKNVSHGQLKFNKNGSFLYKNSAPMQTKDSFSYQINSRYGSSKTIKVELRRSEVALEKLPEEMKKTFLPIFYNYNRSDLLVDFKDRVDAVVKAMKARPNMIVELSSYSDCRGSKAYNLKLSQERNQTIIDYVSAQIGSSERIFGQGYGENTVEGNTTLDYIIYGGSFSNYENAHSQQKAFVALGYKAEIIKTTDLLYQVRVDQANTLSEAQKIVQILGENGQDAWIKNCDCCQLSEEEHLQNRKTEFKIIRY